MLPNMVAIRGLYFSKDPKEREKEELACELSWLKAPHIPLNEDPFTCGGDQNSRGNR